MASNQLTQVPVPFVDEDVNLTKVSGYLTLLSLVMGFAVLLIAAGGGRQLANWIGGFINQTVGSNVTGSPEGRRIV